MTSRLTIKQALDTKVQVPGKGLMPIGEMHGSDHQARAQGLQTGEIRAGVGEDPRAAEAMEVLMRNLPQKEA